jgi:hypothetical protein
MQMSLKLRKNLKQRLRSFRLNWQQSTTRSPRIRVRMPIDTKRSWKRLLKASETFSRHKFQMKKPQLLKRPKLKSRLN